MNQKTAFKELLEQPGTIIIDGGLSNQIESQGFRLNSRLWTADLLQHHPQAIVDAHLAYLKAGAQIITTASYQASIEGFAEAGLSREKAIELISDSVELAQKAVAEYSNQQIAITRPLVAASIGPYGAYLADGSEYGGNYGLTDDELRSFHQQRLRILDQSSADILACETIPGYQEAKVLAGLLETVDTPAWFGVSCKDGQYISDGTPISRVAELFARHPQVLAFGVNCTAIEFISSLIEEIKPVLPDKSIIVYPNSGEHYDAQTKTWSAGRQTHSLLASVEQWRDSGVKILGGCCRVGPDQIATLAERLNDN